MSTWATAQVLWGECISGALYNEDFKRLAREVGFTDPRVLSSARIDVTDPELAQVVGNAVFHSITYRLFKLPEQLESLCEDYGQVAVYKVALLCTCSYQAEPARSCMHACHHLSPALCQVGICRRQLPALCRGGICKRHQHDIMLAHLFSSIVLVRGRVW